MDPEPYISPSDTDIDECGVSFLFGILLAMALEIIMQGFCSSKTGLRVRIAIFYVGCLCCLLLKQKSCDNNIYYRTPLCGLVGLLAVILICIVYTGCSCEHERLADEAELREVLRNNPSLFQLEAVLQMLAYRPSQQDVTKIIESDPELDEWDRMRVLDYLEQIYINAPELRERQGLSIC